MLARVRAALAHSGRSLGLAVVFVSAAGASAVLHVDLPASRRVVERTTNRLLAGLFEGRLVIGRVDHISLGREGHARVARVEVLDPEGARVIDAVNVDARIDLLHLLRSLAVGAPPTVDIVDARIERAEVVLDLDAAGDLGIARAFTPRKDRPSEPPAAEEDAPAEDVRLSIPRAKIGHAHVHGNLVPPELDGDVDDLEAAVQILGGDISVEVGRGKATLRAPHAPGQAAPLRGDVTGRLTILLETGDLIGNADLRGDVAGVPVTARASVDRARVEGTLDVPRTEPDLVRRAFPDSPLTAPIEVHATASGNLPTLGAKARVVLGEATLDADAEIDLREGNAFRVDLDARGVDGRSLSQVASDMSARLHVEGFVQEGAPIGTFRARSLPGTVAGEPIPAATLEGRFEQRTIAATLRAEEPGVDASGRVVVDLDAQAVAFDLQARSGELRAMTRAGGALSGSATARASGRLDLARGTIAGHARATGEHIAAGPVAAAKVEAEATLGGTLAAPRFDTRLEARDVRVTDGGKEPLAYESASARARVTLVPSPTLADVEVRLQTAGDAEPVVASADAIRIRPSDVAVERGRIGGVGAPVELEARLTPGGFVVRARGEDLDVHRVAAVTGIRELELLPEGARASLDVDLVSRRDRADGHVHLELSAPDGVSAGLHAFLDGHRITGRARLAAGDIGSVEVPAFDITLPGPPNQKTIPRAVGAAELHGEIDLAAAAKAFGGEEIERIDGKAIFSGRVERQDPNAMPIASLTARTEGLEVVLANQSTTYRGVDGTLHVAYDGHTGDAEVALVAWDGHGLLASANAKARVPLVAWATGKEKLDGAALAALDVGARVHVPPRAIGEAPAWLFPEGLDGVVAGDLETTGPLGSPHLLVSAKGLRLRASTGDAQPHAPIDALAHLRWDGENVVASLVVDERQRRRGRREGHVRGLFLGRLPASDLLAGRFATADWNAGAEIDFDGLELGPLPLPFRAEGLLRGRARVRDLNGSPSLDVHAHLDNLGLSGVRIADAEMDVRAQDGALFGSVRFRQDDGGAGTIQIDSRSLRWHGLDLAWDDSARTRLDYGLVKARLAVLRPFTRSFAPEIDGLLNGRGSATFDAKSQAFEGKLAVTDGRLYVNALGEEVSDITAVAQLERDGQFRVSNLLGKVGAGEIRATGHGRMRGAQFLGAEATVVIPSRQGIPLSAEGATFAEATGEVRLTSRMSDDRKTLLVTVEVPRAKIELPTRTQTLQSLDPDPTVVVGVRADDGTLAPRALTARAGRGGGRGRGGAGGRRAAATAAPEDALVTRFTVSLGDEVLVEGRGIRVYLGGRTVVQIAEEVAITGQIDLRSGTIDVQGRRFVVDHGTITFPPDEPPENPTILAAAYWDAPDKTRVWVEFAGPLKTGKMTLRSEPPFSKNEILALLLFGRADANVGGGGERESGGAEQATAVGGGLVSSGLNRALDELGGEVEIETRVATTRALRSRPEVGVRLRRNLTVTVGYVVGLPTPAEPDRALVTVDWQFIPKWSVAATRGNQGTSILDFIFQHRY
jgi:translocation and assembly module TamB